MYGLLYMRYFIKVKKKQKNCVGVDKISRKGCDRYECIIGDKKKLKDSNMWRIDFNSNHDKY